MKKDINQLVTIRSSNIKLLCHYEKLIYEKMLQHLDGFLQRVAAFRSGPQEVEFVEAMVLQPLELQLEYLMKKESALLNLLLGEGHAK